jgi:hypothetical protein
MTLKAPLWGCFFCWCARPGALTEAHGVAGENFHNRRDGVVLVVVIVIAVNGFVDLGMLHFPQTPLLLKPGPPVPGALYLLR